MIFGDIAQLEIIVKVWFENDIDALVNLNTHLTQK